MFGSKGFDNTTGVAKLYIVLIGGSVGVACPPLEGFIVLFSKFECQGLHFTTNFGIFITRQQATGETAGENCCMFLSDAQPTKEGDQDRDHCWLGVNRSETKSLRNWDLGHFDQKSLRNWDLGTTQLRNSKGRSTHGAFLAS